MEDLLKAAGADPTEDLLKAAGVDPKDDNPRRGKTRKTTGDKQGKLKASSDEDSYGGHNLRQVVRSRARGGETITYRPWSKLATASATRTMESLVQPATPRKSARSPTDDENDDDDDEPGEYKEDDSDDVDEDDEDDDDGGGKMQPKSRSHPNPPPPTPTASNLPQPASTTPSSQPFALTNVQADSELGRAATTVFTTLGYSLETDLRWQAAVGGDPSRIKSFRQQDVTQQVDVVAFAFMCPASPFIQLVHSIATYAVRGGL